MTHRVVTVPLALFYFAAAAYHAGLFGPRSPVSTPATIAETLLGLVLAAAAVGLLRPLAAYVIALAGTLLGLSILIVRDVGASISRSMS